MPLDVELALRRLYQHMLHSVCCSASLDITNPHVPLKQAGEFAEAFNQLCRIYGIDPSEKRQEIEASLAQTSKT